MMRMRANWVGLVFAALLGLPGCGNSGGGGGAVMTVTLSSSGDEAVTQRVAVDGEAQDARDAVKDLFSQVFGRSDHKGEGEFARIEMDFEDASSGAKMHRAYAMSAGTMGYSLRDISGGGGGGEIGPTPQFNQLRQIAGNLAAEALEQAQAMSPVSRSQ
ncbi:MAG: hypothetical protein IT445_13200 [Phycisphaeraceae bacterium]|nr:hypothetical protein [Phycisphaeraceae bacterium]